MADEDYYWELVLEKGALKSIGPKRTIEFFIDAVKHGRQHILDMYDPRSLNDFTLRREALTVLKRFKLRDADLELALAEVLCNAVKLDDNNKQKVVSEYLVDLLGRFIWNPEHNDESYFNMAQEYASFKASGDYITLTYGLRSKPELSLTKAEAEHIKKSFAEGKKTLSLSDILANGQRFFSHSSEVAGNISSTHFFRMSDKDKQLWERRARHDEKLAKHYYDGIELLRTANYTIFH